MRYELRDVDDDKGFYNYSVIVRINDDGSATEMGADRGEPEDNSFDRDYKWVLEELNRLANIIKQKDLDLITKNEQLKMLFSIVR